MRYLHYLLYAFGGLGLAACSSQSSSLEEGEAAEAEEVKFNAQQEQTTVQLYVATRKPFEYQIQVNGKVEAGQQAWQNRVAKHSKHYFFKFNNLLTLKIWILIGGGKFKSLNTISHILNI